MAVLPLAPRHSGRGAGPGWGLTLVCRTGFRRSRKVLGFGGEGECLLGTDDDADAARFVRPCAYSRGLTWDGRPLVLVVGSPVLGSQRTSWRYDRDDASRSRDLDSRKVFIAASEFFLRSRRIVGILLRGSGLFAASWGSSANWDVSWVSSMGETSPG